METDFATEDFTAIRHNVLQGLTCLVERLANGGDLVVAEGYLLEFERRGYLKAGCFVPEVVLEHPDLVRAMHEEFVHAGSDVVVAFTYYAHREKMRVVEREDEVEKLNRNALKIARAVADETGTLMAGNLSNSTIYQRDDQEKIEKTEAMFKEQVEWAQQHGADYIVAETIKEYGEAKLALDCIQKYGKGVPAVITFAPQIKDSTMDGIPFSEACRKLEEAGAAAVGLNCHRGPRTAMPLMTEIRRACKGPIAAVPACFRTNSKTPTYTTLRDPETGKSSFPVDLNAHACGSTHIEEFAKEAKKLGVEYVGLCCGNCASFTRILAETYGRHPPASKYAPDMSQHHTVINRASYSESYKQQIKEAYRMTDQ